MKVVVALGGNAILRRGVPMTIDNQRVSIAEACAALATIARDHDLVVTHGNGPQVGLLASQAAAYGQGSEYPFDVLDAQTEGMIGYLIEQELGNRVGDERAMATVVTRVEVAADDPAFTDPTKFIGPTCTLEQSERLADLNGWEFRPDGDAYRRVVPSPRPLTVIEIEPIRWIVDNGGVTICAGGGGVPCVRDPLTGHLTGVEAVVDKDLASMVLADALGADLLIIATDVDGVMEGFGTPEARTIAQVHPDAIDPDDYPAGSMRPKVEAAVEFTRRSGRDAIIGALTDIDGLFAGTTGTRVTLGPDAAVHHPDRSNPALWRVH